MRRHRERGGAARQRAVSAGLRRGAGRPPQRRGRHHHALSRAVVRRQPVRRAQRRHRGHGGAHDRRLPPAQPGRQPRPLPLRSGRRRRRASAGSADGRRRGRLALGDGPLARPGPVQDHGRLPGLHDGQPRHEPRRGRGCRPQEGRRDGGRARARQPAGGGGARAGHSHCQPRRRLAAAHRRHACAGRAHERVPDQPGDRAGRLRPCAADHPGRAQRAARQEPERIDARHRRDPGRRRHHPVLGLPAVHPDRRRVCRRAPGRAAAEPGAGAGHRPPRRCLSAGRPWPPGAGPARRRDCGIRGGRPADGHAHVVGGAAGVCGGLSVAAACRRGGRAAPDGAARGRVTGQPEGINAEVPSACPALRPDAPAAGVMPPG
ncbi:protein of unknown function (plasmid) [Cupriavidus taiwanensis]|uniref:Uncharacterized protein n=1 Tax=Cupriavidus taiwanensis TaxID=164546 RepID=A0A7Z7NPB3_9BURK|nr:protein of unknown function [Cupriavidus taiwanensis]SOZ12681.1 protein of unknown function [Cupriavidus taiwanensis]SOZ44041.1 protein of unknown function [Cupriavidus taiwanensis]SPC23349.1 protein of unknown function [Cupriavidus taiwanensis]SPD54741.1 protein of unknown function [Cupriavidus taiwanensis]